MRKEYDFSRGRRGAVLQAPATKTRITIRLDRDVLDWFRSEAERAGGGSYQAMINEALRSFVDGQQESFEAVVRRVVRDELRKAKKKTAA